MTDKYQTIKIRKDTHRRLKLLAARTGESMLDLVDRLAQDEAPRIQSKSHIDSGIDSSVRENAPGANAPKAS